MVIRGRTPEAALTKLQAETIATQGGTPTTRPLTLDELLADPEKYKETCLPPSVRPRVTSSELEKARPVCRNTVWTPSVEDDSPHVFFSMFMPWKRKGSAISQEYPSLISFVLTISGELEVRTSKDLFARLEQRGPTFAASLNFGGRLLCVLPGDGTLRNKICNRFGGDRTRVQDSPEIREYIEDVHLLYPEINAECCLDWTDELIQEVEDPLQLWDKRAYLILRCGREVVVFDTQFWRGALPQDFLPDLSEYRIKDRKAVPELLAVVMSDQPYYEETVAAELFVLLGGKSPDYWSNKYTWNNRPVFKHSLRLQTVVEDINARNPITNFMRTWFAYHVKAGGVTAECDIPGCDWPALHVEGKGVCGGHKEQAEKGEFYLLRLYREGESRRCSLNGCELAAWDREERCARHHKDPNDPRTSYTNA